jgi:hypothetical protein
LNRLRENPDFKVLLAEELQKRLAAVVSECKQECTRYMAEIDHVYKHNAELTRDYTQRMSEYVQGTRGYEERAFLLKEKLVLLEDSVRC